MTKRMPQTTLPWLMYFVAASFYLYEFLLRVSPNVLAGELIHEFSMDAKQFGLFSSLYFWAYAPLQLPVGAMTDNYGPRRLLTIAVVLCSSSTIILAFTHDFVLACLARVFIGAGSAFAFICTVKIIQMWFPSRLFPFLTGLTLAVGTLGAAMGGTPLSFALRYVAWRDLLIFVGVCGLLLSVAAYFIVQDKPLCKKTNSNQGPGFWQCLSVVARKPQSWLVGIYAFFVTAPSDAFGGAWGVKFLTEVHGISLDAASFASVTMTFVGMAVGSPLLGWLSGYFDNRKVPMSLAALLAATALTFIIYLPHMSALTAALLFFAFGATGTYVLAFVVIRKITDSEYIATAVGFVNMLSILGSAIVTYVIGWVLDWLQLSRGLALQTENFQYSLVILPAFYLISALIVVPMICEKKA